MGRVRPLFQDEAPAETRDVTRAHAVLDHRARDGVEGILTITGGKFCTFRLMAQDAVYAASAMLGTERPCRTADEPLPDSEERRFYRIGERLAEREQTLHDEQLICECELVRRGRLEDEISRRTAPSLDDIRRALRLGMGPCQGGFCTYRATGILHQSKNLSAAEVDRALLEFLQERWKGVYRLLTATSSGEAWPGRFGSSRVSSTWSTCRAAPAQQRGRRRDRPRRPPGVDVVVVGAGDGGGSPPPSAWPRPGSAS